MFPPSPPRAETLTHEVLDNEPGGRPSDQPDRRLLLAGCWAKDLYDLRGLQPRVAKKDSSAIPFPGPSL